VLREPAKANIWLLPAIRSGGLPLLVEGIADGRNRSPAPSQRSCVAPRRPGLLSSRAGSTSCWERRLPAGSLPWASATGRLEAGAPSVFVVARTGRRLPVAPVADDRNGDRPGNCSRGKIKLSKPQGSLGPPRRCRRPSGRPRWHEHGIPDELISHSYRKLTLRSLKSHCSYWLREVLRQGHRRL